MTFESLTDAYLSIHQLREFFDENAREIDPVVRMEKYSVDPVATLHEQIQDRFYAAWKCWGMKPFVHDGRIVYWDHHRQKPGFVDLVESSGLPDSITRPD